MFVNPVRSFLCVSLTAAALLFAGKAEARPNEIIFYTTPTGVDVSVKPLGKSSIEVVVDDPYSSEGRGFIAVRDCNSNFFRFAGNLGYTEKQMFDITTVICR